MSNNGSTYKAPSAADFLAEFMAMERSVQANKQKSAREKVMELLGEDVMVTDRDGNKKYPLNADLILRQGVDASELRHLKFLHREKLEYFAKMHATSDKAKLREYAYEVECVEFQMQEAWHFGRDKNFHEWYKVPKCTCPKMDNAEMRGTSYKVISQDCPVHGDD